MTLFRAAKQNRIFEDVVDQIQKAIISGRLKDGARLPAERELRDMFQTSRSTIREALRVLEQKGLVEIKLGTGGGAVVKAVSTDTITETLALLIQSQRVSLNHLAEFRERVEGDVAALACERRRKTDIEQLQNLLSRADTCVRGGDALAGEFMRVDRQLHYTLATITDNPIYISILKTIHDNIQRYFKQFLIMPFSKIEENHQDLVAIVDAVGNGHADRARALTQSHVHRFSQYMAEKQRRSASGHTMVKNNER